jgi:hypothetical protein
MLTDAERLLVGSPAPKSAAVGTPDTRTATKRRSARALFDEMQRNMRPVLTRYGELLQQLDCSSHIEGREPSVKT